MSDEVARARRRIPASAKTIFAILSDPSTHADIDGTGWVREPLDTEPLTGSGQLFRMRMYHDRLPDKHYEMTNQVTDFDAPNAIGWRPGQADGNGGVRFGGWTWGYRLDALDEASADVTLIYDWSGATAEVRDVLRFPPFKSDHLDNSLAHLDELARARAT